MNRWVRRSVVFVLVLTVALAMANTARRLTAQASDGTSETGRAMQTFPPSEVRSASHLLPLDVDTRWQRVEVASSTPPQPHVSTPPVLTADAPRPSTPLASSTKGSSGAVRTFHDRNYKISFDYPANWTFSERDHEISTFRLDARSADKKTSMRAVTAIPENPYPASTFTGAYVYLSVTPHSNDSKCAAQASGNKANRPQVSQIGGVSFAHGHNEQRKICTVERDEIYTTYRKGACYRFDLAINNFCGGEVSGVKDVTQQELDTVRSRLESIFETVRFDPK